jgi:tetratricopeptide (TPR) repeat protein
MRVSQQQHLQSRKKAFRTKLRAQVPVSAPPGESKLGSARNRGVVLAVSVAVGLLALACYWPAQFYPFSTFDDFGYVDERHIVNGLSGANIVWALTSVHFANWHPLTSITFMIDRDLWGADARPYHLWSILGHALNTSILFALLRRMTGSTWRSAVVAATFGLHPLHVESVVWIAERKDVLSAFFFLTATAAYVAYVRRGGRGWYVATALLFALGLMSKPMVVTLPLVLLLLDYWPLRRVEQPRRWRGSRGWRGPVLEKLPLLGMSALSSLVTFIAQRRGGTVAATDAVPLLFRLENALVSYVRYVWKSLWPRELAAIYPLPPDYPLWQVLLAAGTLAAITALIVSAGRTRRYLVVGWLWFLGTLVPVIGLVQVGPQAMADRYTYLPMIGLTIMLTWGAAELLQRLPRRVGSLAPAAICSLLVLAMFARSRHQMAYWSDSERLFRRVVEIAPRNPVAQHNLGNAYLRKRKVDDAIACYHRALDADPWYVDTYNSLGAAYLTKREYPAALAAFEQAALLAPDNAEYHNRVGSTLMLLNDLNAAEPHVRRALALDPRYAAAMSNIALIELRRGDRESAERRLRESIRLFDGDPQPHHALGQMLHARHDMAGAVAQYRLAVRLDPASPARNNLAWILATTTSEPLRSGAEAVRLAESLRDEAQGDSATVLDTLAAAYAETGDFTRAADTARAAADAADKAANPQLAAQIRQRLAMYEKSQPYRE